MIGLIWDMTRGFRLRPWKSPYLRWRIETYSGISADRITFSRFFSFGWEFRWQLLRYLRWARSMR
jgi:hypothetical protein